MMHDMYDLQCLNAGITPGCYRHPASPFIGEGKAQVTKEEKEEDEKVKKSFRIVGSFFSFTWVPPTL